MTRVAIIIISLTLTLELSCQQSDNFSAQIDMNYYYYLMSFERKNYFNSGYTLLFSYCTNKFKYSIGINYSSKNSYYHGDPASFNQLIKRDYKLSYLNIPLLITYGNTSARKVSVQFISGIIFNYILDYDITSYYANDDSIVENNIDAGQKTGISLRLGVNLSHQLSQKFILNLSPFIDFKFALDHYDNYRPNYKNLTDDRFLLGVRLGIEYIIRKFPHNEG